MTAVTREKDRHAVTHQPIFSSPFSYSLKMKFLLASSLLTSVYGAPNFHACNSGPSSSYSFCDPTLSIPERVSSLLNMLTLEEKVYLTQPQEKFGNLCGTTTGELERLGLSEYTWLIEVSGLMELIILNAIRYCVIQY